jgi:hypothetical protein
VKFENSARISADWLPCPISSRVTSASRSTSPPLWSSTWNWKPPSAPRPRMGGGRNGTTIAPLICPSSPRSCATTACADRSAPRRSASGSRRVNIMARFGAAPAKLNPTTAKTLRISRFRASTASVCRATPAVYSSDAPSGACTWTMKYSWSSSGRKAVGTMR